jgi:RNA polymerase sigma-70 factor (ECF subfamily)
MEPQADIDHALRRVQQGDTSAFEQVVRSYEKPLRAWLASHAPPGVDVDDLAQRSFIAAFTGIQDFELGSNFGAWLFTIARYQLLTETTRLRRIADYHSRYAPDLLLLELERRAEAPPLTTARLEHLSACLAGLSVSRRRFIDWRYRERIPLAEMAERSGRSIPAVKKQLWKLRQHLQRCVESRLASEQL